MSERTRYPNVHPSWNESRVAAALARAVKRAIDRHRRLGQQIAYMRDGKIVVEVPKAPAAKRASARRAPRGRRAPRRT